MHPSWLRAKRNLVSHDKFFYFDAGCSVRCAPPARSTGPKKSRAWRWKGWWRSTCAPGSPTGPAACTLLLAYQVGQRGDFVVYDSDIFSAIEVKRAAKVHSKDLRALHAFREDYPEASACLLYMGKERLAIDGFPCIPCDAFLKALHPDRKELP
ncbi:protein of unknown function [Georgfuchsia toluolica]|uniref:DUF4143 domain-containing protein n=1 Tax=Georgfuchsia toluolica TaxID=424218 RepID=A0A916J3J6_9PROT|nr:hypothetical protein [Georgfuchsia toluolica]CAG4883190.1 protein of unknown function [Georgfuchsia toluolica]